MLRDEDRQLATHLGSRVRAARELLEMTQEQVAELVDLSAQVYSRLERGKALPSLPTLLRICGALRTTPDKVLVNDGRAAEPRSKPVPSVGRLIRMLEGAEPGVVRTLLVVARGLTRPSPGTRGRDRIAPGSKRRIKKRT
jgi:transcriptional regulator with XRE-family HTH domain